MTKPYPIVHQRSLHPVGKRGVLGLAKRRRDDDELPRPAAHEVLVYRVNGQHLQDTASRPADDEQVVAANHVSVVDLSRDAPVMVRLDIPSAEASDFTVQVTFTCTVNDPVAVVRDGLGDAETVLRSHLMSHQRTFELGLNHKLSHINEVRRAVSAQIRAFIEIRPIIVPGMTIKLASVEVLTPQELIDFEKSRRGQHQSHTLAAERQMYDHTLQVDQQRDELTLEEIRQLGEQNLTDRRRVHERRQGAQDQEHDLRLDAERRRHQRLEFEEALALVGSDPRKALQMAFAAGQMTPDALADRLHALDETDRHRADTRFELERRDELQQLEWQHEEQRQRWLAEREDRLRDLQWTRSETLRVAKADREDRRLEMEGRMRLLSDLATRGHLDTVNVSLERLINDIVTAPVAELDDGPQPAAELENGPSPQKQSDGRSLDEDAREEDAD